MCYTITGPAKHELYSDLDVIQSVTAKIKIHDRYRPVRDADLH